MALSIDIISDVVCPWCFIGKRRLEAALGLYRQRLPEALVGIASAAGLDRKEAEVALADDKLRRAVAEEEDKARAMGVNGVPFFIFNNRLSVEGAQPPEVLLDAMLEAEKESAAT